MIEKLPVTKNGKGVGIADEGGEVGHVWIIGPIPSGLKGLVGMNASGLRMGIMGIADFGASGQRERGRGCKWVRLEMGACDF